MSTEITNQRSKVLGIPAGVIIGLCVLGYVFSLKKQYSDMIAFPLIFFPMLATLGAATLANFAFWFATGSTPKRESSGSRTNDELLQAALQRPNRHWVVVLYRHLQSITMVGAGYISICPIIGIIIFK